MKNLCKKYNIKLKDMLIFSNTILKSLEMSQENLKKDNNLKEYNKVNLYIEAFKDLISNGDIKDTSENVKF